MIPWSPQVVAVKSLRRLNQAIFSCFLDPTYQTSIFFFEKRIHQQKRKFMRAVIRASGSDLVQLNQLFDCMMNYAQLRWRISDFTVFSVCGRELNELSQAIGTSLKKNVISDLPVAIQHLEDMYQQILQVSSPDPLAFLLFLDGVKGLCAIIPTKPEIA